MDNWPKNCRGHRTVTPTAGTRIYWSESLLASKQDRWLFGTGFFSSKYGPQKTGLWGLHSNTQDNIMINRSSHTTIESSQGHFLPCFCPERSFTACNHGHTHLIAWVHACVQLQLEGKYSFFHWAPAAATIWVQLLFGVSFYLNKYGTYIIYSHNRASNPKIYISV